MLLFQISTEKRQKKVNMKNPFCKLEETAIRDLPEKYQDYLLSYFACDSGYVYVPRETFQEMIDIIAEKAVDDSPQVSTKHDG